MDCRWKIERKKEPTDLKISKRITVHNAAYQKKKRKEEKNPWKCFIFVICNVIKWYHFLTCTLATKKMLLVSIHLASSLCKRNETTCFVLSTFARFFAWRLSREPKKNWIKMRTKAFVCTKVHQSCPNCLMWFFRSIFFLLFFAFSFLCSFKLVI